MIEIRRRKKRSVPGLNLASMPDLIFTVLFFFMIVTHMRKEEIQVRYEVPAGTEVTQATKKHAAANIYIGKDKSGVTRIQVNDKVVMLSQVGAAIQQFRKHLSCEDVEAMNVNLRVDKGTPMGVVNDVKMELRKVGALTIRYSATGKNDKISEK